MKFAGAIFAVLIVGGAIALVANTKSERAKYDSLKIGMTTKQVQAIVGPKTGGYNNRFYTDIADNDTLHVRDIMVLTLRDGRLVDKKWLGKERK